MASSPAVSPGVEGECRNLVGESPSSTASEHLTENSSPHPDNAPFQASVEDCPEEENAVTGTPRPVDRSPVGTMLATPAEPPREVDMDAQPAASQEHSMPAFIQLSGPSYEETAQIQPGALHYLDPASPVLTQEAIQRSVSDSTHIAQPVATSPSVLSHSSVPSSNRSDVFSQGGHRDSFSHDSGSWGFDFDDTASHVSRKQFGGPPYHSQGQPAVPNAYPPSQAWPGSPHSQYSHPHASPFPAHAMADSHQRPPIPPPQHNSWPPHQRPAVSGYQCLAAILTGELFSQPKVLPIYRRFETLNHRLLLQMQDEIVELEQQLDRLDEDDSQARMTPNGPWPASRRSEVLQQGKIYFEKQRLFREIGLNLQNYYGLLESFRTTQCFSCPAQHEVAEYRDFFAKQQLIAESETRFLDRESDLISLNTVEYDEPYREPKGGASRRGDATPTPQSMSAFGSPQVAKAVVENRPPTRRPASSRRPPTDFAYAVLGAVAAPLLSFCLISGFLERMVIVGIVFAFGTALVVQSSVLAAGPDVLGWADCSAYAVIYCVFMGVVAWSFA